MNRALDWMSDNGKPLLFGAIGVIVGVFIAMPLGWHLPDPVTNLLGAVAGSVATIGGAIVLWKMQERKTALHTLHAIQIYAEALWTNAQNVGLALSAGEPGRIVKVIERGNAALENEAERVARIHSQLQTLTVADSTRFYDLESLSEEYRAFCEAILLKVSEGRTDATRLEKWKVAMEKHREGFADFIRSGIAAAESTVDQA